MSVKLMADVLDNSPCTGTELLVHLILANHANDDGICWPSIQRIAAQARCSERHAQRCLESLRLAGFVERSTRPGHSNLWRVSGVTPASPHPRHPRQGGDDTQVTQNSNRTIKESGAAARRDEVFEAICEVCGIDWEQLTKDERGRVNAAAKQLRELDVEPGQIRFRARVYRKKYPEAQLTPQALTGNWSQLDNASTPAVSSTAPPEFVPEPEATREEKAKAKEALQGILDQLKGKMVDEA